MAEPLRINRFAVNMYLRLRPSLETLRNYLAHLKHRSPLERQLFKLLKDTLNYDQAKIDKLRGSKLSEFVDKLTGLRKSLERYEKSYSPGKPRGHIRHALSYIGRLLRKLSKRALPQPLTIANPIPQKSGPNLRSQVVNDVKVTQNVPQEFQVRIPIQAAISAEPVSSKADVAGKTVFAGMLAELLRNVTEVIVKNSLKDLTKKQRRNQDVQQRVFESVVEKLNSIRFLSEYNLNVESRSTENRARFEAEDKLEDKPKVAFSKKSQKATASGRIIFKTLFDSKGNVIGIEIAGKLKQPEILEAARQAVNLQPHEMVPALTKVAVEAVRDNPKITFEVLDFVARTISQTASANRVDLNVSAARAMQLVVGEVVHTLLSIPDSPGSVAHSQITAKDRANIAYQVLERYPKAVLPVLQDVNIRANEAGNLNVKRASYSIANRIIQTDNVQKELLSAFAQNPESPLVASLSSSTLGREMIIKAAQSLIGKAKAKSIKGPLSAIVNQIVLANPTKFKGNIAFETARDFLKAVSALKLYGDIARSTSKRGKPVKAGPKKMNYFAKSYRSYTQPQRAKSRLQPAVKQKLDKVAKEVFRISDESNLILPHALTNRIKEHQASIAGASQTAPVTNAPVGGHFTPPETSPRARAEVARADALAAEIGKPETPSIQEMAPLAAVNPQVEEIKVKLDPMVRLVNEIWRLLEVASYDKAAAEVRKAIIKLREANNGIKSILTAMQKFDPLALEPLYKVDLARRLKKIEEEQKEHASA